MLRVFLTFIILCVMTTFAMSFLGIDLGHANYWDKHGLFLLLFLSFFPRLALLFSSIPFGGLFWWLGFFLCPRYLIAVLATLNYWHQDPILVTMSWFIALGGESSEKYYIQKKIRRDDDVIDVEVIQ